MIFKKGAAWRIRVGLSLFTVIISIVLLSQATCFASSVTLQWGSSSGAAGYKVYYQADSSIVPFSASIDAQNQTTATVSGLDSSRSYYFAVVAYDSSHLESAYSNLVAIHPLSVTLSGSGTGDVNSSPSGMSCVSGTCTSQFVKGSTISLFASPSSSDSALSYFSSWSGCSSTSGSTCNVDVNSATNVTATFAQYSPVHIANSSNYYSTLQTAYNYAASSSILQAQAVNLIGNLTTSTSLKSLTIAGGYDATFSGKSGYTVMQGTLTVSLGSLVVDNLVIK